MNEKLKNNRYFGALLLAPFFIFLFIGGIYLELITFLLSILGMYEAYKVIRSTKQFRPISIAGYLLLVVFYITRINLESVSYLITLSTLILLCLPIIKEEYNFVDVFITIGIFIYVGIFFSCIPNIYIKPNGKYLVWLIFISSWIGDTAAYYSGRAFGKRKLCPTISPKKTLEGSIGGFIGSILGCGIYGIILSNFIDGIPLIHFFLIGALSGILSQFGDLTASSIKRYFKVKDYSHLIPGHGGILDRFDSILFSAVVIYFYISFIIGI